MFYKRRWITGLIVTALATLVVRGETNYTVLKSFGFLTQAGYAADHLIGDIDGNFYGAALLGGSVQQSASPDNPRRAIVFRLSNDGSNYAILRQFETNIQNISALVLGTNGVLFGTTDSGGASNRGVVFSLTKDGAAYTILHHFSGAAGGGDGDRPVGLMQASDGFLYGTTTLGGTTSFGTVFRLRAQGTDYSVLRRFSGANGEGKQPLAGLLEAADGRLYGTTHLGGTAGMGTIFRLAKDGSEFTVVTQFLGTNGSLPKARLIEGSDGRLYGTTEVGGRFNLGTVFALSNTGALSLVVLHDFAGGALGSGPVSRLIEGTDGALYGLTPYNAGCDTTFKITKAGTDHQILRSCVGAFRLWSDADQILYLYGSSGLVRLGEDGTEYEPIRRFDFGGGDADTPTTLMESSDGVLYGASANGGRWGAGTIFKLNRDGSDYAILHHFTNQYSPVPSRLLEASDGAIYGLLRMSGMFKINKDGSSYTNIYIAGSGTGFTEASDGRFYGTSLFGGAAGRGFVFGVNKDGSDHVILHSFTGNGGDKDGAYPEGGVLEASDGWLFGASKWGGSRDGGMIYKLRKDGTGYVEVYAFPHFRNEAGPSECVVEGPDGALYGATLRGGAHDYGFVFRVNKDGTGFAELLSFPPRGFFDGQQVMVGSDGVLYGITIDGGTVNQGTLFRVNRDGGHPRILHNFMNRNRDGGAPHDVIIEGRDGAIYGTTQWGGELSLGTVFRLVPPPEIACERPSGGPARVVARTLAGASLAIETSTNFVNWTELASGAASNAVLITDDHAPAQHRFYRARRN